MNHQDLQDLFLHIHQGILIDLQEGVIIHLIQGRLGVGRHHGKFKSSFKVYT